MKNRLVIEFESGRYWIEDDIIRVRFVDKLNDAFTIDDANMHLNAYNRLVNVIGNVPILIDVRGINSIISLDILRFISKRVATLNKNEIAKAYLINSLGVRLLVNFYIRVIMSESTSELFEDEEAALNWLEQHKN